MRILLLTLGFFFTLSSYPQKVAQQHPLIGTWKLISLHDKYDMGEPQPVFGEHPKGYLILTTEGRMMALGTSDIRRVGFSDAERADLEKSMFAYSGKYRIEGDDFVTMVDVSWNEAWNGTEQRRHYKLDGDKLTIVTLPRLSTFNPKQTATATLIWEREK